MARLVRRACDVDVDTLAQARCEALLRRNAFHDVAQGRRVRVRHGRETGSENPVVVADCSNRQRAVHTKSAVEASPRAYEATELARH